MTRAIAVAVLAMLLGCGDETPGVATPRDVGPSPLPSFDSDRLWILVRAANFEPNRCRDYYRGDDEALRNALRDECKRWEKEVVKYLRLNGLPTLEPEHIAEPYYIDWFYAKAKAITECQKGIPVNPGEGRRRSNACDPWEDLRFNQRKTPAEAGIVFPPNPWEG